MDRTTLIWFLSVAFVVGTSGSSGHAQPGTPPGADPEISASEDIQRVEHLKQIETCRAGLLDPEARDAERRRWADQLLSFDSAPARDLLVELLKREDRPRVRRTLCEAIRDRSRVAPDRLSAALIEPILAILGAESDELRLAAGRTLADFPGAGVPTRLGEIAASGSASRSMRLAAVDALAPNTHRRDVVAQLIPLLDCDVPEVRDRAIAALEPASSGGFGGNLDRWHAWWDVRSQWREEDWLAEQLQVYRRRSRQLADEYAAFQRDTRLALSTLETQFRAFQRELFRTLATDQRDARLVEWLDAPLSITNETAIAIIKARIADEGKRPEGPVLAALLRLLRRATGEAQRNVLEIVQTLNDPVVVDAVLGLLDREREPNNRHAVFSAIGRLDSPKAVPALIHEIADNQAPPNCVREAAIALGLIARSAKSDSLSADAIEPLKHRYAALTENDTAMRAALVSAMAGLGAAAFTGELIESVESDDPTVLQPALRGLLRLGDASKLSRFRTLTSHTDPLVRLVAIDAVAEFGGEDADLDKLMARLDPANEPNAPVREAAWRGFENYMARRPVDERIRAAGRLRDAPALELRYLTKLADSDAVSNGAASEFATVIERLASVLTHQNKFAQAAVRWRRLFELKTANQDPSALDAGIQWLDATLHASTFDGLSEVLARVLPVTGGEPERSRIAAVVQRYLESPAFTDDTSRANAMLVELRSSGPREWSDTLDRAETSLAQTTDAPPPNN